MISISNCPITGLQRKVDYEFFWYKRSRQIIIQCYIDYYKDDVVATANITRLKPYKRALVASDTLVNSQTGVIMTPEQISNYHYATGILNDYNLQLQMYNNSIPIYEAAMITYNAALTQYNLDVADYNTAMTQYNIDNTAYTAAMEQYDIDMAEYMAAMQLSPPNPENLPQPVMPIAPMMPVAPVAPVQPIEPVPPVEPSPLPVPGPAPIEEYDFYATVLGIQPLILPTLLENIILLRDSEGKFNI